MAHLRLNEAHLEVLLRERVDLEEEVILIARNRLVGSVGDCTQTVLVEGVFHGQVFVGVTDSLGEFIGEELEALLDWFKLVKNLHNIIRIYFDFPEPSPF